VRQRGCCWMLVAEPRGWNTARAATLLAVSAGMCDASALPAHTDASLTIVFRASSRVASCEGLHKAGRQQMFGPGTWWTGGAQTGWIATFCDQQRDETHLRLVDVGRQAKEGQESSCNDTRSFNCRSRDGRRNGNYRTAEQKAESAQQITCGAPPQLLELRHSKTHRRCGSSSCSLLPASGLRSTTAQPSWTTSLSAAGQGRRWWTSTRANTALQPQPGLMLVFAPHAVGRRAPDRGTLQAARLRSGESTGGGSASLRVSAASTGRWSAIRSTACTRLRFSGTNGRRGPSRSLRRIWMSSTWTLMAWSLSRSRRACRCSSLSWGVPCASWREHSRSQWLPRLSGSKRCRFSCTQASRWYQGS